MPIINGTSGDDDSLGTASLTSSEVTTINALEGNDVITIEGYVSNLPPTLVVNELTGDAIVAQNNVGQLHLIDYLNVDGGEGTDTLWLLTNNPSNYFNINNPNSSLSGIEIIHTTVDGLDYYGNIYANSYLILSSLTHILGDLTIYGSVQVHNTIWSNEGNDTIYGNNGNDFILGAGGDDHIFGDLGDDDLGGNDGDDVIDAGAGNDYARGGAGNDTLSGYVGNDALYGDEGNDTLDGSYGDDMLFGGSGNDALTGGNGYDTLDGGSGDDILSGVAGNDVLNGGTGNDTLNGGTGSDIISGGAGNDALYGDGGADILSGDEGNDVLSGGTGNDTIQGATGNDTLAGGDGNDLLYGGSNDDIMDGGADDDYLSGYDGNDVLNGGSGIDRLFGGAGADRFVLDTNAFLGRDSIKDFLIAQGDRIELHGILQGYTPPTSHITDFVKILDNGTHSYLYVDADGTTNGKTFVQIARFENVTGLTDEVQLVSSGTLLLT